MVRETFWVFTTAISKTIYYSSISEAIVTFIVTSIAAFISLILLFHTAYKFYVEDISHILEDDFLPNERRRKRTSSAKKSRAKLPQISKASTFSEPSHHKEIHQAIAFLTMLFLLSGLSYTLTQTVIRIMTIFFDSHTSCLLNEYLQTFVAATRSMLYLLFLCRLYLTFMGSHLAYSSTIIIVLGIIIFLANFGAYIYWIFDTSQQINNNNGTCSAKDMDYTYPAITVIVVDTLINFILLYLFVHKLSQLIRTQCIEYQLVGANLDTSALKRTKELIKLMTKLTVLACIAVISSWITTAVFIGWIPGVVTQIDVVVGNICILFCYEFHQQRYMDYCFLPRQFSYHVCFWWFISEDFICKKNDEDDFRKDGFKGGCWAWLCVFKKYDNSNTGLYDGTEELFVKDGDSKSEIGKTFRESMKSSKDSDRRLNVREDNKGKQFTDQILRSQTDEFSKTLTETEEPSVRKGEKNSAFAHRAYTLKKIQHLLCEDEGIGDDIEQLKMTLGASKKLHTLRTMRSIPIDTIQESMDIDEQKKVKTEKEIQSIEDTTDNKGDDKHDNNEIKSENTSAENDGNNENISTENDGDNKNMSKEKSIEIVYKDSGYAE